MNSVFSLLIIIAALAVLVSLILGLVSMVRKEPSEKQNKMMQFRVGFQFIALVLLGIMFALK